MIWDTLTPRSWTELEAAYPTWNDMEGKRWYTVMYGYQYTAPAIQSVQNSECFLSSSFELTAQVTEDIIKEDGTGQQSIDDPFTGTVNASFWGTEYPMTYNADTGLYACTIPSPQLSDWSETAYSFPVTITATNDETTTTASHDVTAYKVVPSLISAAAVDCHVNERIVVSAVASLATLPAGGDVSDMQFTGTVQVAFQGQTYELTSMDNVNWTGSIPAPGASSWWEDNHVYTGQVTATVEDATSTKSFTVRIRESTPPGAALKRPVEETLILNAALPRWSFIVLDAESGVREATVQLDNGTPEAVNIHNGNIDWVMPLVATGEHTVTLAVTDNDDNTASFEYTKNALYLITDRTQSDIDTVRSLLDTPIADWTTDMIAEFNAAAMKGAYNASDFNRVIEAMDYIDAELTSYGYATGYRWITVPHKPTSRLPEGYTELEYIEGAGNQYVDTGLKPNQNTTVEMQFKMVNTNADYALFGSRDSAQANMYTLISRGSTFRASIAGTISDFYDFGADMTQPVTAVMGDGGVDINGSARQISTSAFQCAYTCLILAARNGSTPAWGALARLYYCRIYDGETLVRDYVPATDPGGTAGLFDLVNAQFYGNAGSGAFTPGPSAANPPDPELDPYTWYESDIPTEGLMEQYLANVQHLRDTLILLDTTPPAPEDMALLNWVEANNIEQILVDIQTVLIRVVAAFNRCGAYTFWSGAIPLPSARSDLGHTWADLEAMGLTWDMLDGSSWYQLLYGNFKPEVQQDDVEGLG